MYVQFTSLCSAGIWKSHEMSCSMELSAEERLIMMTHLNDRLRLERWLRWSFFSRKVFCINRRHQKSINFGVFFGLFFCHTLFHIHVRLIYFGNVHSVISEDNWFQLRPKKIFHQNQRCIQNSVKHLRRTFFRK